MDISGDPPVAKGVRLVGTNELPASVRHVFKFPYFNAVQSKCFAQVYENDDNFVLSAPTGSGKTAVLELAICRLAVRHSNHDFKVIYQAPTKSLCSERQNDWEAKFGRLGLKCAELTGDTDLNQLHYVKTADIIVTTPEKWDSVTRRWKDHKKLLELIRLFLIDEVHILKEDRGASLEAVVSRMKSIGTNVRFLALSATVPNSEDIATWLGINNRIPGLPANREVLDESFRPVKLQKHVLGIQAHGRNDFAFDQTCSNQLPEVITRYSAQQKPIMVFCMTRRTAELTASQLATWWMENSPETRPWNSPPSPVQTEDQNLRKFISAAVAFHHAGLSQNDRSAIEKGYLTGNIKVICCTSTLAVGINLPCHLVIIKNTISYQAEGCKEYSDLEIMQMLGRAGRPQFDDSAIAVIMTRAEKVEKYEKMVSGQEMLESRLHLNLIEHLNAEISLGTIRDITSAKMWMKGTFLYVRLQKNPDHYNLQRSGAKQSVEDLVEKISAENLELLYRNQLLHEGEKLISTEFGDTMSRYYVQFDTMKLFLGLQPKAKISEILSALAQASEFKAIRFRLREKPMFKSINESPSIKFPIQVDLATGPHKVSLVLQAALSGLDMRHDNRFASHIQQFQSETTIIFQHIHRLIRCVIDCQLELEDAVAVRNALELCRSFGARVWDDSPLQMLQIDRLGPVAVRKLVGANIRTIEDLETSDAQRIEMILSRNPPFGNNIIQDVTENFPKLRVSLKSVRDSKKEEGNRSLGIHLEITAEVAFLNQSPPATFRRKPIYVAILAEMSDGKVTHFRRISAQKIGSGQSIRFGGTFFNKHQFLTCFVSCEDIAGTQQQAVLNPNIPASAFSSSKFQDTARKTERNISSIRKNLQTPYSASQDSEYEEIEDGDSFSAEDRTLSCIDQPKNAPQQMRKPTEMPEGTGQRTQVNEAWRPIRLPNGNWACQHPCKDKSSCKHLCCREGLDRPPKRPKNAKVSANCSNFESNAAKYTSMKESVLRCHPKTDQTSQRRLENFPNISRRRSPQQLTENTTQNAIPSDEFEEMDEFLLDMDMSHQILSASEVASSTERERKIFVSDSSSPDKGVSGTYDNKLASKPCNTMPSTPKRRREQEYLQPPHKKTKTQHGIADHTSRRDLERFAGRVSSQSPNDKDFEFMTDLPNNDVGELENFSSEKKKGNDQGAQRTSSKYDYRASLNQPVHEHQSRSQIDAMESKIDRELLRSKELAPEFFGNEKHADPDERDRVTTRDDDNTKQWLLEQFGDIIELI